MLGRGVKFRHPREARAAGIGLVTEDRKRLGLFAAMNVGENISICTLRQTGAAGFISRSREWRMAAATADKLAVRTAGLKAPITTLSGGNQQKCIIGRWLQTQPNVLLLDDPTRGVDYPTRLALFAAFEELATRSRVAMVILSTEIDEIIAHCHRAVVFRERAPIALLDRAELTRDALLAGMFGLPGPPPERRS